MTRRQIEKELAKRAGVGPSTVSSAYQGERVSLETAEKLAQALEQDMKKLFTVEAVKGNLSPKTIRNYHTFAEAQSRAGEAVAAALERSMTKTG